MFTNQWTASVLMGFEPCKLTGFPLWQDLTQFIVILPKVRNVVILPALCILDTFPFFQHYTFRGRDFRQSRRSRTLCSETKNYTENIKIHISFQISCSQLANLPTILFLGLQFLTSPFSLLIHLEILFFFFFSWQKKKINISLQRKLWQEWLLISFLSLLYWADHLCTDDNLF